MPDSPAKASRRLLDASQMDRVVRRMAGEIVEHDRAADLILVGIRTRGVPLAERIADRLQVIRIDRPLGEVVDRAGQRRSFQPGHCMPRGVRTCASRGVLCCRARQVA